MKRKINVGVFTFDFYPFIGGQGRHVYELYLQNKKYKKVNIYVFSPSDNQFANHVRIFPETQSSKLKHLEFSLKLNNQLHYLVSKYKLDIAHIHGGPGGLFLLNKPRVPVVITSHHTYWQQYHLVPNQQWKVLFFYLEKYGYKQANKIICVSEDTMNILTKKYEISDKNVKFIPNGIDKRIFKPKNENLHQDTELLYVGRIDKRKGLDFLLEAMLKVKEINPKIKLQIVGEGKDSKKLKNFAKMNSINAVFHGSISDMALNKLYDQISIQIIPSLFEGFGITALEAMAKKIPVIATNVDGLRDIVQVGKTGLLVDYGDTESMSNSILNLIQNKKLGVKIVSNAYKELDKYSWEDIYKKTIRTYDSII